MPLGRFAELGGRRAASRRSLVPRLDRPVELAPGSPVGHAKLRDRPSRLERLVQSEHGDAGPTTSGRIGPNLRTSYPFCPSFAHWIGGAGSRFRGFQNEDGGSRWDCRNVPGRYRSKLPTLRFRGQDHARLCRRAGDLGRQHGHSPISDLSAFPPASTSYRQQRVGGRSGAQHRPRADLRTGRWRAISWRPARKRTARRRWRPKPA